MEYNQVGENITVDINVTDEARYWPGLCGDHDRSWAIWDTSLTMNTTNPDMPMCLQSILLVWLPCFFLWFGGACRLIYLSTLPYRHPLMRFSKLCITKLFLFAVAYTSIWRGKNKHIYKSL